MKFSQLALALAAMAFATASVAQQASIAQNDQGDQKRSGAVLEQSASAGGADEGVGSGSVSGISTTHIVVGAVVLGGIIAAAASGGGGGSSTTTHH